jgi:hypothetical protein
MSVTVEVLNNGEPFTEGRYAGQIGRRLKFQNGDPSQNVYAPSEGDLLTKIAMMYGNTRTRLQEVKRESGPKPAAPALAPVVSIRMTPEERLQAAADLQDPARMGQTIVRILKDETGFDPQQQRQQDAEKEAAERRRAVVEEFIAETPDFYRSKKNGTLLRNHVAANFGTDPTVADWVAAFTELDEMGVLESAPEATETTPAASGENPENPPSEPSAPAPVRSPGTGLPPSSRASVPRQASGQRMTREEVLKLAHENPSEYGRRLSNDPAFAEMVNKVLA